MENQEEIEKIKALMQENEREIEEIKAKIKQAEKEKKEIKLKIVKTNILIYWQTFWFYASNILKLPVYILMVLYMTASLLWDRNLYAMMLNIYHQRYTREELDIIFGHFNTLANHATFLFYILILSWYTFLG